MAPPSSALLVTKEVAIEDAKRAMKVSRDFHGRLIRPNLIARPGRYPMSQWTAVAIPLYLVAAAVGAWWSFRNADHRPDASISAKIISSILMGMVWPWIAMDVWLLDPGDTRRSRRGK